MKRAGLVFILSLMLLNSSLCAIGAKEPQYEPLFLIYLISPNISAAQNQCALLVENQLLKIGIDTFTESTSYFPGDFAIRVWDYPLIDYDYIPTHVEGGYDVVFVGWSWDFDWDPTGFYDIPSLPPFGYNFYQYQNPNYDDKLWQYLSTHNQTLQNEMSHKMQNILYEDLPSITLVYPKFLYGFKDTIVGVDTNLSFESSLHSEIWDDPEDHVIRYAIPMDLKEWNSFVLESYYDNLWMQTVYGSLFRRNLNTHEWESYLADNYEISSDGLNFTINIDPNAKFSDGSPLLAEDIDYTYELHITPAVGSSRYSQVSTWFYDNNSIQAVDSHTINFNFTAINPFAPSIMSYEIIDKSEVEPLISSFGYSIFNDIPLTGNAQYSLVKSCGPFMLDTFGATNNTVKMVPNPFWNDSIASGGNQPLLDELYFKFVSGASTAKANLISGNIDIVDTQYYLSFDDFDTVGIEARTADDPSHQEIAINLRHPIIGTGELTPNGNAEAAKYIRKAISHAIPRQVIVDVICNGLGSLGISPIPPVCVGFNNAMQPYEYNLTLAREYMEMAGYELTEIVETTETPTGTTATNFIILFIMIIGLTTIIRIRKRKR